MTITQPVIIAAAVGAALLGLALLAVLFRVERHDRRRQRAARAGRAADAAIERLVQQALGECKC